MRLRTIRWPKKGLKNWRPQWQIEATTHKDSTMTYVDAYSYIAVVKVAVFSQFQAGKHSTSTS